MKSAKLMCENASQGASAQTASAAAVAADVFNSCNYLGWMMYVSPSWFRGSKHLLESRGQQLIKINGVVDLLISMYKFQLMLSEGTLSTF